MVEFNSGQDIWVCDCYGPRCVTFVQLFPPRHRKTIGKPEGKAVVTFFNEPQIIDMADTFATRSACYRAAAVKKQAEASLAMQAAAKYLADADKAEESEQREATRAAAEAARK